MQTINEIQPIFPEKKGCMGAGKTQAVIVDHKETYESCFQDAKLTRVSNQWLVTTTNNISRALAFIF